LSHLELVGILRALVALCDRSAVHAKVGSGEVDGSFAVVTDGQSPKLAGVLLVALFKDDLLVVREPVAGLAGLSVLYDRVNSQTELLVDLRRDLEEGVTVGQGLLERLGLLALSLALPRWRWSRRTGRLGLGLSLERRGGNGLDGSLDWRLGRTAARGVTTFIKETLYSRGIRGRRGDRKRSKDGEQDESGKHRIRDDRSGDLVESEEDGSRMEWGESNVV
jgi:hypothetical protein